MSSGVAVCLFGRMFAGTFSAGMRLLAKPELQKFPADLPALRYDV